MTTTDTTTQLDATRSTLEALYAQDMAPAIITITPNGDVNMAVATPQIQATSDNDTQAVGVKAKVKLDAQQGEMNISHTEQTHIDFGNAGVEAGAKAKANVTPQDIQALENAYQAPAAQQAPMGGIIPVVDMNQNVDLERVVNQIAALQGMQLTPEQSAQAQQAIGDRIGQEPQQAAQTTQQSNGWVSMVNDQREQSQDTAIYR